MSSLHSGGEADAPTSVDAGVTRSGSEKPSAGDKPLLIGLAGLVIGAVLGVIAAGEAQAGVALALERELEATVGTDGDLPIVVTRTLDVDVREVDRRAVVTEQRALHGGHGDRAKCDTCIDDFAAFESERDAGASLRNVVMRLGGFFQRTTPADGMRRECDLANYLADF